MQNIRTQSAIHFYRVLGCAFATFLWSAAPTANAADLGDLGTVQGTPAKPRKSTPPIIPRRKPSTRRQRPKPGTAQRPRPTGNQRTGQTTPRAKSSGSATRTSVSANLTGTWETTDGWTVHFTQNGNAVTGNYTGEHVRGTIRGTFHGTRLTGTFSHRQGSIAFSGDIHLTYSAGKLEGEWNAGDYSEAISATRVGR